MIDYGIWESVPLDVLPRLLDGGAATLNDLKPSEWLIKEVGRLDEKLRVLDFGCGVGRDIVGMVRLAPKWKIVGYDNPRMISKAAEYVSDRGNDFQVDLVHDWKALLLISSLHRFDVIFCNLVFQHIPEMQLRWYLSQFHSLGDELFVYGRRAIDRSNTNLYGGGEDFESVWKIVLESGFETIDSQRGHDADENGNDHKWMKFKTKERNVRQKHRAEEQRHASGNPAHVGLGSKN